MIFHEIESYGTIHFSFNCEFQIGNPTITLLKKQYLRIYTVKSFGYLERCRAVVKVWGFDPRGRI